MNVRWKYVRYLVAGLVLLLAGSSLYVIVDLRAQRDALDRRLASFCARTRSAMSTQRRDFASGTLGSKLAALERYEDDVYEEGPKSIRFCLPDLPTFRQTCVDAKDWSCLAAEAERVRAALLLVDPIAR